MTESITTNNLNYYTFAITNVTVFIQLVMAVTGQSPNLNQTNPKMYLGYQYLPNPYSYDYVSFTNGNTETIIAVGNYTQLGVYNLVVYSLPSVNVTTFTYQLNSSFYCRSFSFFSPFFLILLFEKKANCPNGCSGNGNCTLNGVCVCDPNFRNVDCSYCEYKEQIHFKSIFFLKINFPNKKTRRN